MNLKLGYTIDLEIDEPVGLYLPPEDRSTHLYVLGSSGVGKSKALANWIVDDIEHERGCGVIDPHGDLVSDVVANLPKTTDVILADLTDPEYSIGFNPLELQEGIDPFTQTLELVEVFRKIWDLSDDSTPRLLEILRNSIFTLIEAGKTMLDIEPLLTNNTFRNEMIRYVKNEAVAGFWANRFDRWQEKDRVSFVESTLNKVSTFTSDPRSRLMLSSPKSTINFREIMDQGKTILINLSKGVLKTNSYLLGALFVAKIQMAAMSRVDKPFDERRPFFFYVDEFQNYATYSFAEILSEARKYGLSLILAHQNLVQLDEKLKEIILGNAKNFVCFRLDRQDAELLVKYLYEIDTLAWKYRTEDHVEFLSVQEQWEEAISEICGLDTQVAILKTKGKELTFFRTFELFDSETYADFMRDEVRRQNFDLGYTRKLADLDEALVFQSSSLVEPDEPESFYE